MNSPALLYAFRWLVRDTFCQAVATRIFWIMLAASGLCILFCLGVSIEGGEGLRPEGDYLYDKAGKPLTGPNPTPGKMSLLFGALRVDLFRDGAAEIHLLQVILGTWVAGAAGVLFTLVWTAGFLPEFLQPGAAAVLFAKPMPRWLFLVGKYLGVLLFVAFQAVLFFAGTWLALGVKTGFWLYGYLGGIPLLLVHFAAFYGFSMLLATLTRSTVACILGTVLFWVLCVALNYARHAAAAWPILAPDTPALPAFTDGQVQVGYWVLPKPADLLVILEQLLDVGSHKAGLSQLPEFETVLKRGDLEPGLAVLTSLLSGLGFLALAGYQVEQVEY